MSLAYIFLFLLKQRTPHKLEQVYEFKEIFLAHFAVELKENQCLILRNRNDTVRAQIRGNDLLQPWIEHETVIYGRIFDVNPYKERKIEWEFARSMEMLLHQRTHQISAAIVSTLKLYKTAHILQISERVKKLLQHRFKVRGRSIYERMIALKDLEYIRQDEDNLRLWHYIA